MLNSSARIPRYRRFAGHLAMTRARLAERRGVAYSFAAEDLHLLPTHQFAWRSQIRVAFPPVDIEGLRVERQADPLR